MLHNSFSRPVKSSVFSVFAVPVLGPRFLPLSLRCLRPLPGPPLPVSPLALTTLAGSTIGAFPLSKRNSSEFPPSPLPALPFAPSIRSAIAPIRSPFGAPFPPLVVPPRRRLLLQEQRRFLPPLRCFRLLAVRRQQRQQRQRQFLPPPSSPLLARLTQPPLWRYFARRLTSNIAMIFAADTRNDAFKKAYARFKAFVLESERFERRRVGTGNQRRGRDTGLFRCRKRGLVDVREDGDGRAILH